MKSILVLPAIFSVGVTQTHAAEATRPNILFISVDDLGHSTLCCRGSASLTSGMLLRFGKPNVFLPVSLVEFQIEERMVVGDLRFAVPGLAPVADQHVRHGNVQDEVDRGKKEQNANRPDHLHLPPGDCAEGGSGRDHQQAQPLRKIFLPPEVVIAACQAALRSLSVDVCFRERSIPVTLRAVERAALRAGVAIVEALTVRALINDLHGQFLKRVTEVRVATKRRSSHR